MQESSFIWTLYKVKYCWKLSAKGDKSNPINLEILGFTKVKKIFFLDCDMSLLWECFLQNLLMWYKYKNEMVFLPVHVMISHIVSLSQSISLLVAFTTDGINTFLSFKNCKNY